ncbi:MAG: hypothetical protein LBK41_06485 [Clostridiales bacterium]|nr:hypothetical protein [Clostridiales bacterium]
MHAKFIRANFVGANLKNRYQP